MYPQLFLENVLIIIVLFVVLCLFIILLSFLYYRNNVECAGICLSKQDCYAFQFVNKKCNLLYQPTTEFNIQTQNGLLTLCLDHQNWSPTTIYADNNNIPPMCPSKSPFLIRILHILMFRPNSSGVSPNSILSPTNHDYQFLLVRF